MDTRALRPWIVRFLESLPGDPGLQEQFARQQRRKAAARECLQRERLPTLSRKRLAALLQDTDAWAGLRWTQHDFRQGIFGEAGEHLPALRGALAELVERGEAGLSAADFNRLAIALPSGLGPTFLAELLALRFPERYWPWNAAVRGFLATQGVDLKRELPRGRKRDVGAEYLLAGQHLEPLRQELSAAAGQPLDFPLVAVFVAWVNRQSATAGHTSALREPSAVYRIGESQAAGAHAGAPGWSFTFPGFRADTFEFLRELAAHNRRAWMERQRERYERVLRKPLGALLEAVAPAVAALDPAFETDARAGRLLSNVQKHRPDEEGPYYTFVQGAFYRRERKKSADAQLFVGVYADAVYAGLSLGGRQAREVLARFRQNLAQAPKLFLRLVQHLPSDVQLEATTAGDDGEPSVVRVRAAEDLPTLATARSFEFTRRYPAGAPILQQPEFAGEVADLFRSLYPLWQFATSEDPQSLPVPQPSPSPPTQVAEALQPAQSPQAEPRFTLEQLCSDTFHDGAFWEQTTALLADKGQIVFYGPPGTGKTYMARVLARYWLDAAPEPGGDVRVVQFHPSYAYEDFVEGIRPQSRSGPDGRPELSYPVTPGVFRRLVDAARGRPQRRYVLILDEINRGELPRIFGELLYLLEYREETVTLPYSGAAFSIPANLFVIGTMNTADRSIALVDHAVRRRFHFVATPPRPEALRTYLARAGRPALSWTADLLERANAQLAQDGFDWHWHIGHSHFMRPDLGPARVRLIWEHSVLPTLEEYFYRQPERLAAYQLDALVPQAAPGPDDAPSQ